jgi:hypothetical protein
MSWYLGAASLPIGFDAQQNPVPALFLFAVVCLLLWFLVVQARRRDERKAKRGDRDLSGWRSRQPPRY